MSLDEWDGIELPDESRGAYLLRLAFTLTVLAALAGFWWAVTRVL